MNSAQPLIGITVSKSVGQALANTPLFALNPLYVEGVVAGGGAPLQVAHGVDQTTLRTIFDRVDGLLLSGGGDVDPAFFNETAGDQVYGIDRQRDEVEMRLVHWALEEDKPLFAICRGIQVMNVALGGSLYQDILSEMLSAINHAYFQHLGFNRDYPAHDVQLISGSRLVDLLGGERFSVNSLHHQGIKGLAPDLTPVGYAPDGLVEAVEVDGHRFAVGVQWHPEALAAGDPAMQGLFEALVVAAQNGHKKRS